MVTSCRLVSVVIATASIFVMPVTTWGDGLPNPAFLSPALASFPEQAESNFNYVPPYRGTPRRTQGTGSRGGDESETLILKLLVPNDHTGQTLSGHPTFSWYVSEIPEEPVEFALVESGVAQPIFVQQLQLDKAGIIELEMPKNLPELVPGKEYRWSVSLVSNAEAGAWYDALNVLLNAQSTNPTNGSIREALLSLLDRAGLTEVAAQERQ